MEHTVTGPSTTFAFAFPDTVALTVSTNTLYWARTASSVVFRGLSCQRRCLGSLDSRPEEAAWYLLSAHALQSPKLWVACT